MSAKQAIDDKLQGSVAAHLRCGGVVNIQITKGLLLSLSVNFSLNRLIFDRIMVLSLWPRFLAHPVCVMSDSRSPMSGTSSIGSIDSPL